MALPENLTQIPTEMRSATIYHSFNGIADIPQDRQNEIFGSYYPVNLKFSENKKHDDQVKDLMNQLNVKCMEYMTNEELVKIDTAVALMHYGHQGHKRKDKEETPYVIHLLRTANYLASKFQMDWETIAAALCHDVLEDSKKNGFPVSENDLSELLSSDVSKTVKTLSKTRLPLEDEEISETKKREIDEETFAAIMQAINDNPRAAVIKIVERLDNMREVKNLSDVAQKRNSYDTLKYYVPLAQLLGLYEEARELAKISLEVDDPVFSRKLEKTLDEFKQRVTQSNNEFDDKNFLEILGDKVSQALEIRKEKVRVLVPDIYAVYKKMGSKREPTLTDCFLAVDIDMPDWRSPVWFDKVVSWASKLIKVDNQFNMQPLDIKAKWLDFNTRHLPSFEQFFTANFGVKTDFKVNFYPKGGFDLVQIPITKKYYHKAESPLINKARSIEEKAYFRHIIENHKLGQIKWNQIKSQVNIESVRGISGGEFGRKVLDFTLTGKMDVLINENGQIISWPLDINSTVLDFAIDRYSSEGQGQTFWQNAQEFLVNGKRVQPNYPIRTGDQIEVKFSTKKTIKPDWIRSMETSSDEYKDTIRTYYRNLLQEPAYKERIQRILFEEAGIILSKIMEEDFVVAVERSATVGDLSLDPFEFLYRIALGEVEEQILYQVASELKEYQRDNLAEIVFYFSGDEKGLQKLVAGAFTERGINIQSSADRAGYTLKANPTMSYKIDLSELYQGDKSKYEEVRALIYEVIEAIRKEKDSMINPDIHFPDWMLKGNLNPEFEI